MLQPGGWVRRIALTGIHLHAATSRGPGEGWEAVIGELLKRAQRTGVVLRDLRVADVKALIIAC
jgi:hypothetical protein